MKCLRHAFTGLGMLTFAVVGLLFAQHLLSPYALRFLEWRKTRQPASIQDSSAANKRNHLAFQGYHWHDAFWLEEEARRHSGASPYAAFRVWAERPWSGKYVNVEGKETDTLRRTVNNLSHCRGGTPKEVWVFGASTVWGWDNPDHTTIPSFLSQKLNLAAHSSCFRVSNFGVSGYNSNQSLLFLIESLKRKPTPAMVIFYEGGNDAFWGLTEEGPFLHPYFVQIQRKVEALDRGQWGAARILKEWLGNLRAVQVVRSMKDEKVTLDLAPGADRPRARQEVQTTLHNYLNNVAIGRALGKQYGFKTFHFWQPATVYPVVPYGPQPISFANQAGQIYQAAEEYAYLHPDFIFLGRFFEDQRFLLPAYFTDWIHTGPRANELIAQAIADFVLDPAKKARRPLSITLN